LFTPATKAETGHDINIPFDEMVARVGRDTAERISTLRLAILFYLLKDNVHRHFPPSAEMSLSQK
jgi:hypothetical protein